MAHLRQEQANQRRVYEPNRRCSIVEEVINDIHYLYIDGPPEHNKTELVD
jgi:hypothetical protein